MASIIPPHPILKVNQPKKVDEQSIIPPHPNKKDGPSQEFKEQSIIPPSTSSYSKYLGKYKGSGRLSNFEIKEKNGKLIAGISIGDVELANVSGDKFKGKKLGQDVEVEFTVSNNAVTGGKAIVAGQTITFTKESSTPTPPPPVPSPTTDEDGITWNEVLESTWDALKNAGYWVKKEGGKLLAAIKDGKNVKKEEIENIFKCINAYNKWWGYYKLSEGWDGVNKYAYEHTTHKVNGREVKLLYMDDGRVVMRFEDNDSDVPGGGGKWECDSEGTGYRIKWSNGQVAVFSKRKDISKNSSTENSSNTDNSKTEQGQSSALPKFKEVCKAILPCPKRADVESGKASYKICMRCPEIAELQSNPVFKVIYFKKLKDRGFKESADGVFGPITKLAVEEYQEMNGLVKDGLIGQKTLAQLDKDKSGRK